MRQRKAVSENGETFDEALDKESLAKELERMKDMEMAEPFHA